MTTRRKLQLLLWAYFWMLIFEGAFRRWIFPGLADVFLVARDPICLAALLLGSSLVFRSGWAKVFAAVGIIATFLALTVGHGSPLGTAYGLRLYLLHYPLIFLFPLVFEPADAWKFAKTMLLVAIPMTVLIGFQHYLPQTHWVNLGVGGTGSAGFGGALGRFRPPGTFSFISGVSMFYPLCAALLAGLLVSGDRPLPKWILLSAAGIVMALPLSISRTVGFSYMLVGAAALGSGALSPRQFGRVLGATLLLGLIVAVVASTGTFRDSMKAFSNRWEGANQHEGKEAGAAGALRYRTVDWIGRDLVRSFTDAPLFGVGLGSGTSGGAQLIGGTRGLNFGEGEWGIILFELGLPLGFVVILTRLALALYLLARAAGSPPQVRGAALPVAVLAAYWIANGVSGQPTSLGFMVLSAGLCLVMTKRSAPVRSAAGNTLAPRDQSAGAAPQYHAAHLR
jgi:hypothetical protein